MQLVKYSKICKQSSNSFVEILWDKQDKWSRTNCLALMRTSHYFRKLGLYSTNFQGVSSLTHENGANHGMSNTSTGYPQSFGADTPFPYPDSKKASAALMPTQMFDDEVKSWSSSVTI